MRVVDDPVAYKLSKAEAASAPSETQAGTPLASASTEPSSAKTARKRSKSSESNGTVMVTLPADGFVYLDPSFFRVVADTLLLPADHKRLTDIGLVESVEWNMAHLY